MIAQVCARWWIPTSSINHRLIALRRTQTVYLALQIAGGHIGLVVVLAYSVFSNGIHRGATYINFCVTWIFSSVAFSLLSAFSPAIIQSRRLTLYFVYRLYRGTTDNNVINPLGSVSQNMCLTQAGLTEGAQVMTAASTLALVIQVDKYDVIILLAHESAQALA